MNIIVGLGNPGGKYEKTRHNMGFMVLDELLKKLEPVDQTVWEEDAKIKSLTKKVKIGGRDVLLVKPQTYMNNSGLAVQKILSWFKEIPKNLIVIYDDVDLPVGKTRTRFGGGSGGHKGIQSIIDTIGSDKFLRIRLGIGYPMDKKMGKRIKPHMDEFVLARFDPHEKGHIHSMIKKVEHDIPLLIKHGYEEYVSKYNK